jgi:hypothetical protein
VDAPEDRSFRNLCPEQLVQPRLQGHGGFPHDRLEVLRCTYRGLIGLRPPEFEHKSPLAIPTDVLKRR